MKYFYAKVKSKKEMSGIPFGWNVAGEMNFLKGKVVIGYINGLAFIPTEMIFRKKITFATKRRCRQRDRNIGRKKRFFQTNEEERNCRIAVEYWPK
jgi:hypothetical protein